MVLAPTGILFLLPVFALAGIVLVAVLMLLKLSVSVGNYQWTTVLY